MIKVISFKICPFVQRITALLEAKEIPYEIEFISLSDKPQWFLDMSPNGQVPVLITESGTALFESDAIAEYLEEAYPALQPDLSPEQKASNRAWSYLASKNYLVQCGAQRSGDKKTLQERSEKLGQAFEKVEAQLTDTRFFGGDTVGMVDIAWLTLLHRARVIQDRTGFDFIGDRPGVKAWQSSLLATDLGAKSVSADFEDRFADFYLSDETYLGRGCDAPADRAGCGSGSCC